MDSLIYLALALVFGLAHHFWACKVRNRIAWYMSEHISRLSPAWGHNIQNWLVRVLLPAVIVSTQGNTPEVLGFRLPDVTAEIFIALILITGALLLSSMAIIWVAISVAKDTKVIRNVKDWSKKLNWRESLTSSFLWTIPEECFLRGYLISQFARFDVTFALLVSTFFTAVLHESRGKFWVLLSVFTGIFFGSAFVLTDSILPSFILHAIDNNVFTRIQAPWITGLIERLSLATERVPNTHQNIQK